MSWPSQGASSFDVVDGSSGAHFWLLGVVLVGDGLNALLYTVP
jgi:hypothetical protein